MCYSSALISYCYFHGVLFQRHENNIYQLIQPHRDLYRFCLMIRRSYLYNIQTNKELFQRSMNVLSQKQKFRQMLIVILWLWVVQTLQRRNSVDLKSPPLTSTPLKSFNCPTWRKERDCFLPSTMSYTHQTPPHRDQTPSWVSYTTITV